MLSNPTANRYVLLMFSKNQPSQKSRSKNLRKGTYITKATQTKIKSVTKTNDTCRHIHYLDKDMTGE